MFTKCSCVLLGYGVHQPNVICFIIYVASVMFNICKYIWVYVILFQKALTLHDGQGNSIMPHTDNTIIAFSNFINYVS